MSGEAPFAGLPEEVRALMARIGPIWGQDIRAHSAQVKEAFNPLLAAATRDGVEVIRDIAYGAHPRQVLDLMRPASGSESASESDSASEWVSGSRSGSGAGSGSRSGSRSGSGSGAETMASSAAAGGLRPVVVFVHGGAFIRGEKRVDDQMYDNVLLWFAGQGLIGVNLEYRLAPEASYPGGADDVAQAVQWLHRNVAGYGGDPGRIFMVGHSAGGTHVASYAYDPAPGYGGRHLAGIVLISARLRADVLPENPNAEGVEAYFGSDRDLHERRSPVLHVGLHSLPVFIVVAQYENPLLDVYGLEMAHRIALASRKAPPFLRMKGHNHMSIVAHFNTAEDFLGREILDFFRTVEADAKAGSGGPEGAVRKGAVRLGASRHGACDGGSA